jgi:sugar O-acyltransferase (sialic acid O-acetyltransferase NeuD family)
MSDIYIIGSGGFSKEVYFLIKKSTNFNVVAFIDKNPINSKIEFNKEIIDVLDEDYFLSNIKNVNVCIGIGNPKLIKKVYYKYSNYNFPNIIHDSVIMDFENCKIGKGNIFTAGCILTTHINIGDFNIFNLKNTIGHDVSIESFNVFNPSVNISGNCKIGSCNLFGVGSVVLEKLIIGNNSILGANSTLIQNMEDNSIYVGSPAKYKKDNK